jgi:hypothetical protein
MGPARITDPAPALFSHAVDELRQLIAAQELELDEVRAPNGMAPFAFALAGQTPDERSEGRLILLFNPDGEESWGGASRLVAYVRSQVSAAQSENDEAAWGALTDALVTAGALHSALVGTVTSSRSTRFGHHTQWSPERDHSAEITLRASWSPVGDQVRRHGEAWCRLLTTIGDTAP